MRVNSLQHNNNVKLMRKIRDELSIEIQSMCLKEQKEFMREIVRKRQEKRKAHNIASYEK